MVEEEFPDDEVPDLNDLILNTSLVVNHGSPFTGDGLRPVMVQTVMAGLLTCSPPPDLPPNLAQWVEEAKDGVILVSFGSVITASKMPEEKRLMMMRVFSRCSEDQTDDS